MSPDRLVGFDRQVTDVLVPVADEGEWQEGAGTAVPTSPDP